VERLFLEKKRLHIIGTMSHALVRGHTMFLCHFPSASFLKDGTDPNLSRYIENRAFQSLLRRLQGWSGFDERSQQAFEC
jgi:hypothetical protein